MIIEIVQLLVSWLDFCLRRRAKDNWIALFIEQMLQYSQSHRAYHNRRHILNGEGHLRDCREIVDDYDLLFFVNRYHDFYYDPKHADNEIKSAQIAFHVAMVMGLGEKFAQRAYELITMTTYTSLPQSWEAMVFLDIDLTIFGQSQPVYDRYEADIRKEYQHVPLAVFCGKRLEILSRFLNREAAGQRRIYLTDYFYNKYENTARQNLARAIAQLDWNLRQLTMI